MMLQAQPGYSRNRESRRSQKILNSWKLCSSSEGSRTPWASPDYLSRWA
jgi:hypothetical protein